MHREADDLKLESFGVEVRPHSSLSTVIDSLVPAAPPHDWKHLHNESEQLHEEPEIPGHVRPFIPLFGPYSIFRCSLGLS